MTYICVPTVPSSKISMCIYSMIQHIYKPLLKFAFQQFQVPKFEHQYILRYTIYKPLLKFAFQQFQVPKFEHQYILRYTIYKPLLTFAFQQFQVPKF